MPQITYCSFHIYKNLIMCNIILNILLTNMKDHTKDNSQKKQNKKKLLCVYYILMYFLELF